MTLVFKGSFQRVTIYGLFLMLVVTNFISKRHNITLSKLNFQKLNFLIKANSNYFLIFLD